MWGAVIGDMVGSAFAGKLNNNSRFEVEEHFAGFTADTLLMAGLAEYLSFAPAPPAGRIARKLAEREIAGLQKKHLSRCPELADEPRGKWLKKAGLAATKQGAEFSPVLALPYAYVCGDVEEVTDLASLTCAYISNCEESREAAAAAAVILFSLRHGIDKTEINDICEPFCGFGLTVSYLEIQDILAAGGTPRQLIQGAVAALVKSYDFDSAIRFAAALGREPQTVCALAGAMAEAVYGEIPEVLMQKAVNGLDVPEKRAIERFMALG